MKQILFIFFIFSAFLFSSDIKFNYKINNDEFLYKKRIMENELLEKKFDYIVALKSFLMYNEYISSNLFIHFKLKDKNDNYYFQQFVLVQDNAGTPLLYEVIPDKILKLDDFIKDTFTPEKEPDLETKYNLPAFVTYDSMEKFLTYSYTHTLKIVLRKDKVLERRLNTNSFFLVLQGDTPVIKTNNIGAPNFNIKGEQLDNKFFSFSDGFSTPKRSDFRNSSQASIVATEDYINNKSLIYDKSVNVATSPAFLKLIGNEDNFQFTFNSYSTDEDLNLVKDTNNITIEQFYIIKAEIDLL